MGRDGEGGEEGRGGETGRGEERGGEGSFTESVVVFALHSFQVNIPSCPHQTRGAILPWKTHQTNLSL